MTPKWQRLTYMPATPLYPGRPRVTESEEHRSLARRAAADGMVLLKNDGGLLPLARGTRLAVFGKAQADYVKGGGGSGDTTVAYVRSILDGLREKEREGRLSLCAPLIAFYEENVAQQYAQGSAPGQTVEPPLPAALLEEARAFADTALITICRFSGEGWDRSGTPHDGDYFLSPQEEAMVQQVIAAFPHVAVALNTGGMMDVRWFREDDRVSAALMVWQGGMEGGAAAADLLVGDVCPSGRLTDTFAEDFADYPSSANFDESEDYVAYEDDIYVGYRYFETVPHAASRVCYPFGYGLSYTSFAITNAAIRAESDGFVATARVTNTGSVAGREVVQMYASAPQGLLGKPARVLVGFAKTALLQPGEAESVEIRFTQYDFASYDDTGKVCLSAYVLEKGDYVFLCGKNVRDAAQVGDAWHLNENRVLRQLSAKCVPHELKRRLLPDGSYEQLRPDRVMVRDDRDFPFPGQRPLEWREEINESAWKQPTAPQLADVAAGKRELSEILDLLTDEQLVHLLGGQPNRGVANTFGFGNLVRYGIPNVMSADGPAGLRIEKPAGVNTTAFPCATLLACTWDEQLLYEVGRAGAEEVLENGIGVWLTPAINIHRTPRCGRNFEYYSEDPLLAGRLSAAMVRGIQSMGVAAAVKHLCCNNRETNRTECDSRLSERALREIYLKAFEINVREADPWTIMSSYNPMNGVRTSCNRELLTDILRGEWGFQGMVMTDWYTRGEHWREVNAGNDVKMARGDEAQLLEKLRLGQVTRETLRTSAERVLRMLMKLA
ncbi:MAG: glycoside hydrolase family 3 C-terminal domain-containing protein [bacterium]|nr:glycoside hydrolase family 3 C-terminal domain-containing protein [bacterium]